MIGVLRAETARTVRRLPVWVLTACAVAIAVLVTLHNLNQVTAAQERLVAAQGERAVSGCIVYADGTNSGFCPGASPSSTTSPGSGGIVAHQVTGDPQDFIAADIAAAKGDLDGIRSALAPTHRVDLAVALLGSVPGIALAVVLGALLAGSDYAWGTTRATLLAARSRATLLAGRIAVLWLVVLAWLVLGVVASQATYAFAAPAGLAHVGAPEISVPVLAGAWCALGLFASMTAALAMAMRSSLGGAATGIGVVAVLRFVPRSTGDLGWFDVLRTIARVLTPRPVFASTSSSLAVTGTVGLPTAGVAGGSTSPTAPTLLATLILAGLAAVAAAWAISERHEVR